ncbi:hypothetical protein DXG01_010316 [Tephrocybe rancida]|nr:hypothetical protein DXG01_010316 [Tephrocybe rancida]
MSSYNLHRRANKSGESPVLSNAVAQGTKEVERPPSCEATSRSWSDVVANRPPTPKYGVVYPVVKGAKVLADTVGRGNPAKPDRGTVSESEITSLELSDVPDNNLNPWIMVTPRRSRSLDYNKKKYKVNFFTQKPRTDADPVLDAAEKQLTPEQQVNIKNRYHNLNTHREPSVESHAEGTSRNKGKNVDPRNWGASGIDHADMSVEAQQANLEYYKAQKKEQNLKNNKDNNVPKDKEHTKQNKHAKTKRSHVEKLVNCTDGRKSQTPMSNLAEQRLADLTRKRNSRHAVPTACRAELNPVDQVTSKSYLGQALKES